MLTANLTKLILVNPDLIMTERKKESLNISIGNFIPYLLNYTWEGFRIGQETTVTKSVHQIIIQSYSY